MQFFKSLFLSLFFLFTYIDATAQNGQPKPIDGPILNGGISYGYNFPLSDLKERYGTSLQFSIFGDYITPSNLIIRGEFTNLFGDKVNEDVLQGFKTREGYILGDDGLSTDVFLRFRGLLLTGQVGKLIPFNKEKSRSGLKVLIGGGILQHNIRFLDDNNSVPQIRGELRKGYDRLTRGFVLKEDLYYTHLSSNRRLNFEVGLSCFQGFTSEVRAINFDTGLATIQSRLDVGVALKLAWILPFYLNSAETIYY